MEIYQNTLNVAVVELNVVVLEIRSCAEKSEHLKSCGCEDKLWCYIGIP